MCFWQETAIYIPKIANNPSLKTIARLNVQTIARVQNSIVALDSQFVAISPVTIMDVYNTILERKSPVAESLRPDVVRAVCWGALEMKEVA